MWHSAKIRKTAMLMAASLALSLLPCTMAAAKKKQNRSKSQLAYDQSLEEYVRQANQIVSAPTTTVGSLWSAGGSLSDMARDDKAAHVGDLITIDILETTTAAASGTSKASRSFSASSGLGALYGTFAPTAKINNLFSPQSQNALNGSATTASSHELSTNLTGTVVKVLPNSYLVVQAARDVYVDNQRQHVIVRGIVRPSDLAPDNSIISTQVANLQVEVEGKGVISDETAPPNRVTRLLLKLVGF
jgi:flagellar L-ring protein precursor FlgH